MEQEEDGRGLGEVPELLGVLAYGQTCQEAVAHAQALAFRVMADRLQHGETLPPMADILHDLFSVAA